MTARRARPWQRLRPLVKPLLGAFLALIGVLAPIESPHLPPPLDEFASAPLASAQTTTVVSGDPSDCPEDPTDTRNWQIDTTDESLCVLSEDVCPEHPLAGLHPVLEGTYLTPSTEFSDFCEATVMESMDAAMYGDCAALRGAAIKTTGTSPNRECRIIQPAQCAAQLHRIAFGTCIRVQRRTWSCQPGEFPRNQFNTCYVPPPGYTGSNPACLAGAPDFPILTCEQYVGGDFVRTPANLACDAGNFPTGDPLSELQNHTANEHWCRYDTSFLDVDCHATGATCVAAYAYCIKRASRTGGCDTVAETLRCRALQADYLDSTVSADDVYRQGCAPCVVLPFEALSTECPRELSHNPSRTDRQWVEWVHDYKEDILAGRHLCVVQAHKSGVMDPTCRNRRRCVDPPRGRITWDSSHHSGVAVVNSPITLSIIDIPNQTRTVDFIAVRYGRQWSLEPRSALVYEYSESIPGNPFVRTYNHIDTTRTYQDVYFAFLRGECRISAWPDFRVLVEELWPDNDETAIRELFGASSLAWWTALSTEEQQQHTAARGPMHVEEIRCNQGSDVWCRWTPPRSGYYRLTAAGGWLLRETGSRQWMSTRQVGWINDFLQRVGRGDGDCTTGPRDFSDYDCIKEYLRTVLMLRPDEAGIEDDPVNQRFIGLLPRRPEQDSEWLYEAAAGENYACPPRDVRASCGSSGLGYNYTESEPIGILVHEVQVHTVTPTR